MAIHGIPVTAGDHEAESSTATKGAGGLVGSHSDDLSAVTPAGALLVSRRQMLAFLGAAAAVSVLEPRIGQRPASAGSSPGGFLGQGPVTPLRLPHQLPAYAAGPSYLPGGPTSGTVGDHAAALSRYTVYDDVVVAPEFERYVILRWGDRVFPRGDDYVGYNADYTAFVPDDDESDDGHLWVNHESISFPFSLGAPETPASLQTATPQLTASYPLVIGDDIDAPTSDQRERWGEYLYNIGGSVVRLRRDGDGRFRAIADPANRRYHGLSGLRLNAGRNDTRPDGTPYSSLVSWGTQPHQQGDLDYLVGTGPAAADVFPHSTDGLGNRIIGTGFNCSGSRTRGGRS